MAEMDIITVVEANERYPRHDSATIVELRDGRLMLAWMEHVGGDTIGHDHSLCNIASIPEWEFSNPSVHFTSQGKVIVTYVASRMDDPEPPGRLGRSCMPLKAAIADVDWLYE